MEKNSIINSLTQYILTDASLKTQPPYQIYNSWAIKNSIVLKDDVMLQFILKYIEDVKSLPETICRDLVSSTVRG